MISYMYTAQKDPHYWKNIYTTSHTYLLLFFFELYNSVLSTIVILQPQFLSYKWKFLLFYQSPSPLIHQVLKTNHSTLCFSELDLFIILVL